MRLPTLFFLFLISSSLSFPQEVLAQKEEEESFNNSKKKESFPVPKEKNQLFYLQRDPNSNTVVYVLNINEGKLDESKPIIAYWIRYAEKGQKKDLSFIQRKMAYGVHHKKVNDKDFDIHIQAYKDLQINLKYNEAAEKYQATTKIENKEIVLTKIFVHIIGGSLFNPNVKYIEITGYDPINKARVSHRFTP